MRDRLLAELENVAHSRFLVYLMGPYKPFDIDAILDAVDAGETNVLGSVPENVDYGTLVGADDDLDKQDAVLDLLFDVRNRLRTDPGVNAFLAIDADIPLEEMDAATQSMEFAFASNVVVYIVPMFGDNLGVGIEVGSILEAIFREQDGEETMHRERVVFVHESGVRSAMIAAVRDRWEARVYSYDDREDLAKQIRLFVRDIARRELSGDLPSLDATE